MEESISREGESNMKNFVKIALIVALILVVLGSACCAVSLGMASVLTSSGQRWKMENTALVQLRV